jgi:hypothetical protein
MAPFNAAADAMHSPGTLDLPFWHSAHFDFSAFG